MTVFKRRAQTGLASSPRHENPETFYNSSSIASIPSPPSSSPYVASSKPWDGTVGSKSTKLLRIPEGRVHASDGPNPSRMGIDGAPAGSKQALLLGLGAASGPTTPAPSSVGALGMGIVMNTGMGATGSTGGSSVASGKRSVKSSLSGPNEFALPEELKKQAPLGSKQALLLGLSNQPDIRALPVSSVSNMPGTSGRSGSASSAGEEERLRDSVMPSSMSTSVSGSSDCDVDPWDRDSSSSTSIWGGEQSLHKTRSHPDGDVGLGLVGWGVEATTPTMTNGSLNGKRKLKELENVVSFLYQDESEIRNLSLSPKSSEDRDRKHSFNLPNPFTSIRPSRSQHNLRHSTMPNPPPSVVTASTYSPHSFDLNYRPNPPGSSIPVGNTIVERRNGASHGLPGTSLQSGHGIWTKLRRKKSFINDEPSTSAMMSNNGSQDSFPSMQESVTISPTSSKKKGTFGQRVKKTFTGPGPGAMAATAYPSFSSASASSAMSFASSDYLTHEEYVPGANGEVSLDMEGIVTPEALAAYNNRGTGITGTSSMAGNSHLWDPGSPKNLRAYTFGQRRTSEVSSPTTSSLTNNHSGSLNNGKGGNGTDNGYGRKGSLASHRSEENGASWTAPESWNVQADVAQLQPEEEEEDSVQQHSGQVWKGWAKKDETVKEKVQEDSMGGTVREHKKRATKDSGKQYCFRVFRTDSTFATVLGTLSSTPSELAMSVGKKFLTPLGPNFRIFVIEKGIERVLGPLERPVALQRKRLEQAGYEDKDRFEELGRADHSYLIKFIFKPDTTQTFRDEPESVADVDLYGKGIETPPIFFYKCASNIFRMNLGKNPGLDLPSDFVQICTNLESLNLSQNGMKRIPQGVKFATELRSLDVSNNNISELEHVQLSELRLLETLAMNNNNLRDIPRYFLRFDRLRILNISNNRFMQFPILLCQMVSLVDMDISFNDIKALPDEIGNLRNLEKLVILSNCLTTFPTTFSRLQKLSELDCRRNAIASVSTLSGLPSLKKLLLDHNPVTSLDIHLPKVSSLSARRISTINFTLASVAKYLTYLNLSWSKMGGLDGRMFDLTPSLEILILNYNNLKALPDNISQLKNLTKLSFKSNQIEALPTTIALLPKLEFLDASTNKLEALPNEIWLCPKLCNLYLSTNRLHEWPLVPILDQPKEQIDSKRLNKPSSATQRIAPPLSLVLKRLSIADNHFVEPDIPLHAFPELVVLNLSLNELSEVPNLSRLTKLQELYLSNNKLKSLPREDTEKLQSLMVLHVNGNQLHDLPGELGRISGLSVLDAGNNELRYNIANWPYDYNWNYNEELRYLNFSGNKRLEIRSNQFAIIDVLGGGTRKRPYASFSGCEDLLSLGLMDVTYGEMAVPDESADRRIRTSLSHINGMAYGISDSIGPGEHLTVTDLVVPKFRSKEDEAILGMFDAPIASPGAARLIKYMVDNYANVLTYELAKLIADEGPTDALRRSFLNINRDYGNMLLSEVVDPSTQRKSSDASLIATGLLKPQIQPKVDPYVARAAASGLVLYIQKKTMYVAHCGGCAVVISRRTGPERLCDKHDPFEPKEVARIRQAEGWISTDGVVMPDPVDPEDESRLSRSFGCFHVSAVVSAAPDVLTVELAPTDEFVIVGNQAFWDYVHYKHAVDIAKTERDPMLAAAKLRDIALAYGASSALMVMVLSISDLFEDKKHLASPSRDQSLKLPPSRRRVVGVRVVEEKVQAPRGWVALVFTDIRNSTMLWDTNEGTHLALRMHNDLLRYFLEQFGGYEVKTEGDAFMVAFTSPISALLWCLTVQIKLLKEEWPQQILNSEEGKEVYGHRGELLYRGLSVRMGIHWGQPFCEIDPVTKRMDYYGPMVNKSSRISGKAAGGEITVSQDALDYIRLKCFTPHERGSSIETIPDLSIDEMEQKDVEAIKSIGFGIHDIGEVKLKGLEQTEMISILYPKELANRIPQIAALNGGPLCDEVVFEPTNKRYTVESINDLGRLVLRLEKVTAQLSQPSGHQSQLDTSHLLMIRVPRDASDTELDAFVKHYTGRIENCINTLLLSRMTSEAGETLVSLLGDALPFSLLRSLKQYIAC